MWAKTTFSDLSKGFERINLAGALAKEDIRDRYRRSLLGVLWISLSFLVFIAVKMVIFSQLNLNAGQDFLTYLTIGFALWTFMTSLVIGAANCLVTSRGWVLSSDLPYSIYIFQYLLRCLAEFILIIIAAAIIFAFTGQIEIIGLPYLILGTIIYLITGLALCLCLAPICVRYRDVFYAIQTVMRVLFFATPIIWIPLDGTVLETVALFNPFAHYIEIIRKPLMGQPVDLIHWQVVACVTTLLLSIGIVIFGVTKRRVPIWL